MLKIKCDGKTILHTGDFRGHGYMGNGIYKVMDKFHIAGNVDILITEGTNVDNNTKSILPEYVLKNSRRFSGNIRTHSSSALPRMQTAMSPFTALTKSLCDGPLSWTLTRKTSSASLTNMPKTKSCYIISI